jgi:chorismate-pyruvate lyase
MPNLADLVGAFYPDPARLGHFAPCSADSMPSEYRGLLDHNHHMTVTVERFHRSPVSVDVLEVREDAEWYSRRILLRRQSDDRVVQFGIVRLQFDYLPAAVIEEIRARAIPLGRILIQHNVLRDVELSQLWQVTCGPDLCGYFAAGVNTITFGRTAIIFCGNQPAIQLLEIVAPLKAHGADDSAG